MTMTDNGIVVSAKQGYAQVEVECLEACQGCSAASLCVGEARSKGLLSVKNPLGAAPGDRVMIQIPEGHYSRALIQVFGFLLAGILLGMFLGYLSSPVFSLTRSAGSIGGFLLGLLTAGVWLFAFFRKKNREQLYPVIIDIMKKGGLYGQA